MSNILLVPESLLLWMPNTLLAFLVPNPLLAFLMPDALLLLVPDALFLLVPGPLLVDPGVFLAGAHHVVPHPGHLLVAVDPEGVPLACGGELVTMLNSSQAIADYAKMVMVLNIVQSVPYKTNRPLCLLHWGNLAPRNIKNKIVNALYAQRKPTENYCHKPFLTRSLHCFNFGVLCMYILLVQK